ncbi:hypothetical protein AQUCO_07200174v1 [Aquilegia coerulea]|uniref:Protein HIRA n=1 Tax=Aquilegia coerulea TaxID=218851 RepID=A0A2G5CAN5_AQUCA|nr:hypothetical protein AQUCO_07200174v1 [Aquilegia coerulea]
MIAEKPSWIKHGSMQIFSIDIQPGGLRFATGGGDHKVRIWNMKCMDAESENVQPTQRLLATLRDHFGSVNCVRWAKHGRYLASGSDDQVIQIHERKPGSGTTEFGSGEPPDIENWKLIMSLRGHTADVVDLNWSPDDSTLATGSLDNTIHIWNMSNGICTAVLRGHSSLVKGVTWDPIGSFIASQSDDKTVIIWRTSDWSLVHRTDGHWEKSLGSTFFRRLGWSPCGHFITTTHGFQKPRHSAPVLERGEWSATFDFLGHNAPITVVKFNHSMFRRNLSNGQDVKSASVGLSNGSSKNAAKESLPYNVIAIGSQDRTITVWTTASARPLFVAKHFFSQSVVDLSWSPDGYSLFACSLDGTVATFHFEVKELGYKLTDTELDEMKKSRYGDVRGRQANLAESPAQLLLEAASAKQPTSKKLSSGLSKNLAPGKASGDSGVLNVCQSVVKVPVPSVKEDKKKSETSGDALNKVMASARNSSPLKQKEYRCSDGRKRIIPEALGVPVHQESESGGIQSQALDFPHYASDQREDDNQVVSNDDGTKDGCFKRLFEKKCGSNEAKKHEGITARAAISDSLVIKKVPASTNKDGKITIEHSEIVKRSDGEVIHSSALLIRVFNEKEGEDKIPVCLEVCPLERSVVEVGNTFTATETEVTCTRGANTLWSDRISGKVSALAGNANFWAVGCEDGCLQIYTKCGRRAMPTMMMGSTAVFIDCDKFWKLLLVTRKGTIHVWDLLNRTCLLQDSLAPLIHSQQDPSTKNAGIIKVIAARFSNSGSPLVILANRHAFLYDTSLMCWMRIVDDCFPASKFASSLNLGAVGELASLHVDVGKLLTRKQILSRVTDDDVQSRAHLEAQLASSLALNSSNEYHRCLLSYVRYLAREADESRLREICENFLGPPTGMAESAPSASDSKNPAWDPYVLVSIFQALRKDVFYNFIFLFFMYIVFSLSCLFGTLKSLMAHFCLSFSI